MLEGTELLPRGAVTPAPVTLPADVALQLQKKVMRGDSSVLWSTRDPHAGSVLPGQSSAGWEMPLGGDLEGAHALFVGGSVMNPQSLVCHSACASQSQNQEVFAG